MATDDEKSQFNAAVDANAVKEAEKAGGSGCALFVILGFLTWVFRDQTWYNYLFWAAVACGIGGMLMLRKAAVLKKKYKK